MSVIMLLVLVVIFAVMVAALHNRLRITYIDREIAGRALLEAAE